MLQHDEIIQSEGMQRRLAPLKSADGDQDQATAALAGPQGDSFKDHATPKTVLSMQRLAGNAAVAQLLTASEEVEEGSTTGGKRSPVLDVVGQGGGKPLDDGTRASMERVLQTDLSAVRIHDDEKASASAKAVQARAYTVGNDVVFQSGMYKPDSSEGRKTLAHELTHVVQQRSGPVDGTDAGGGIAISHPDDRFEKAAEANAEKIAAEGPNRGRAESSAMSEQSRSAAGLVAQRDEESAEFEQEEAQQLMGEAQQLEEDASEQEAEA